MTLSSKQKAGTVILTLIGITAVMMMLIFLLGNIDALEQKKNDTAALDSIRKNLNVMLDNAIRDDIRENEDSSEGGLNTEGDAAIYTIKNMMQRGYTVSEGKFGSGYIIKHSEDTVFLPPDLPYEPISEDSLSYESFLNTDEIVRDGEYEDMPALFRDKNGHPIFHICFPVDESYEYVMFMTESERRSYFGSTARLAADSEILGRTYDRRIAVIDVFDTQQLRMLVWPFYDEGFEEPGELSIDLYKYDYNASGSVILDSGTTLVNGEPFAFDIFMLTPTYPPEETCYIAIVFRSVSSGELIPSPALVVILMAAFISIFFIWILSIYRFISTTALSPAAQLKYMPSSVLRRSIIYAMISGLAVFLTAMFLYSLRGLFIANDNCTDTLDLIFDGMNETNEEYAYTKDDRDAHIISDLQTIASYIEQDPGLLNEDYLKHINKIINSGYMVIYDPNGNQLLTDSRFRGLYLGGPGDVNGNFKKLQNGVPSVITEYPKDEVNDSVSFAYGVPLMFKDENRYGVLAAYYPEPDYRYHFDSEEFLDFYSSNDMLVFAVEENSPDIVMSSREDLIYGKLTDMGMREKDIKSHFMDYFRLLGTEYYGRSALYPHNSDNEDAENLIYYVAIPQSSIAHGTLKFSFFAFICYISLFVLVSICLLRGFKDDRVQFLDSENGSDQDHKGTIIINGRKRRHMDVSERWQLMNRYRSVYSPEDTSMLAGRIIIFAVAILIVLRILYDSYTGNGESIISYCINGNWEREFNIFSITSILIMAIVVWSIIELTNFISFLISRFLDTKTETIGRLFMGMIKYLIIILFFYQAVSLLGFDTRAVLASLGLAGLALSLGAKDMISDVIAGLTIVFEGEFQVGDIVEIDSFIGSVEEVGVRTTKLKGSSGNIKIISNRNIHNVINRTHLNSWCAIELKFSHDQSIDDVEKVFASALPDIGSNIPEIINGPFYKGILAFDGRDTRVSIIAECKESDYHEVERRLLRSLNHVCTENNLKLG